MQPHGLARERSSPGYRRCTLSSDATLEVPRPRLAQSAGRVVAARWFDPLMLGVIAINALVLALETYESINAEWHDELRFVNDLCLALFIVELAFRLAAEAPRPWVALRSPWTAFDALVIAASFMPGIRENTTLLRLVRILRVARAVRFLPDLRILIVAIGRSIPGVATLAAGTVVLVFIYGMAGWVLFHQAWPEEYGDIGQAMLSMFLLLTLETLPDSLSRGSEITPWAFPYFLSYVIFAAFIVFNLFIGIVISSMEEARAQHVEQEAAKTDDERDDLAIRLSRVTDELAEIQRELRRAAERAG
jgi:voltage-gated sodium channel